jgi:hypothetical protein
MNSYQAFLQKGKQVELNFANKHLKDFILADKEEDMLEHWDVKGVCAVISLNSLKFDIKGLKKNKSFRSSISRRKCLGRRHNS